MKKIPFSSDELNFVAEVPGFFGAPNRKIWKTPVPGVVNAKNAFVAPDKVCYIPNAFDITQFFPRCNPENTAQSFVMDGGEPLPPALEGSPDMLGVIWEFIPVAMGAMVRPGHPMLEDVNDWKEILKFPDVDSWDWEGQKTISEEFCASSPLVEFSIFSGYFERLISLMEFENAAMAMIDEDQKDALHELFDALTVVYKKIIDKHVENFKVDIVLLHDDWGSQMAPFFSRETLDEMLVPHIKELIDYAHQKGLLFEMHSCGKIESFADAMVGMGVDIWGGQPMNDKKKLFETYGDQIMIQVELPLISKDASDEEVYAAAQEFVDTFVGIPGKPTMLSINSSTVPTHAKMDQAVYELSRKKLCGSL